MSELSPGTLFCLQHNFHALMSVCRKSLLVLEKCKNMKQLKQAHAQIIVGGLSTDSFALSRVMAFCSDPTHGSLSHAQLLYQTVQRPSLCIRNTMVKSFLLNAEYIRTFEIYRFMLRDGLHPDNYTLPYILKACANLYSVFTGAAIHAHVLKLGFVLDIFISNTLILMYMACGETKAAHEVFDGMSQRTAASWTVMISGYSKLHEVETARRVFDEVPGKDRGVWGSMISGYVQNSCFKEALSMFRLMQADGLEPDEAVFVSALCACAQLGAMDIGAWIHHCVNRRGFPLSARLGTALIDMYVKCGNLVSARKLFYEMPERDTICWNAMILGEAMHGDGMKALNLFGEMREKGFKPDRTTLLAILTACSHSGMVDEGLTIFNSMRTLYGIEPGGEHYGCIVDFFGRAGLFDEAIRIMERMAASASPFERAVAWRALLSACWNRGEVSLAEVAAGNLLQLDAHSGAYVLLSNVYENCGRHEDGRRMRKRMRDQGVAKTPGCSCIEVGGCVHEFIAGEQMHEVIEEVYEVLEELTDQMTTPSCC